VEVEEVKGGLVVAVPVKVVGAERKGSLMDGAGDFDIGSVT
jgi:hypothetical protein